MNAECSSNPIEFRFICENDIRNDEVPLVDGLIVKTPDRKLTSKLLNALPAMKEDVLHLKRVKNDTILVGVYCEELKEEAKGSIAQFPVEFDFLTIPIPTKSPITRSQFEAYKVYWPVHYREDPVLETKLKDEFFKAETREGLSRLLDEASTSDGCVIADSSLKILSRASEANPKGLNPLRHPFMRALEKFCEIQKAKRKRSLSIDQYLCNNCYVILDNEPCAMCAMALVHSRTTSVIFKNPSSNGAFITNCQLHLNQKLNHHYDVYQVIRSMKTGRFSIKIFIYFSLFGQTLGLTGYLRDIGASIEGILRCRGEDLSKTGVVEVALYEYTPVDSKLLRFRLMEEDGKFNIQVAKEKLGKYGVFVRIYHRCHVDPKNKSCQVFSWDLPFKIIVPGATQGYNQRFGTQDLIDFENEDGGDSCE